MEDTTSPRKRKRPSYLTEDYVDSDSDEVIQAQKKKVNTLFGLKLNKLFFFSRQVKLMSTPVVTCVVPPSKPHQNVRFYLRLDPATIPLLRF